MSRLIDYSRPANLAHPLNAGCVSWWKVLPDFMGRTELYDLIGYNTGTLTNMDMDDWVQSDDRGEAAYALDFDGSNDYVNCGVNTRMQLVHTDPFSISHWVRPLSTGATGFVYAQYVSTPNGKFAFATYYDTAAGLATFFTEKKNQVVGGAVTAAIDTEKWYHIIGTSDGTNIRLYINGSLAAGPTAIGLSGTTANSGEATIGRYTNLVLNHHTGQLDDIRIYDRALSADEIAELYSIGRGIENNPLLNYATVPQIWGTPVTGNRRRRLLLGACA